jgi:methionyl-tRNA formyltransferase
MKVYLLAAPTVNEFWRAVLDAMFSAPDIDIVGAAVDVRPPPPARAKLRRELRKGRGGYVLVQALNSIRRHPPEEAAVDYLAARDVPAAEVLDLYSEQTLAAIRATKPDCLFRFGFGLIREPVLSLAPKGVVSYHHGDLRAYRGQPVAFWELLRREDEMGVTVQVLNEQLDAGKIVMEKRIPVYRSDSWGDLEGRAYRESTRLALDAIRRLADDGFEPAPVPEDELGTVYTLPNLRTWLRLQGAIGLRRMSTFFERRARARAGRA